MSIDLRPNILVISRDFEGIEMYISSLSERFAVETQTMDYTLGAHSASGLGDILDQYSGILFDQTTESEKQIWDDNLLTYLDDFAANELHCIVVLENTSRSQRMHSYNYFDANTHHFTPTELCAFYEGMFFYRHLMNS